MPRLKRLLIVITTLFAGCTGCALRETDIYRLSEINSQYFLLSPDAATSQGAHQTLRISFPRKGETPRIGTTIDCSIKGPWFSFYPASVNEPHWIAETPTAAAWEQSSGAIDMKEQWQSFEGALYRLQQGQCFASMDEYLAVKQRIAASLSAPVVDTLFYRYAYGPGGYVDLAPGMQLRIERDWFSSHGYSQPRPADYQGTTITNYVVSCNAESGTALRFLGVEKKLIASATPGLSPSDAGLATQFATAPHLRLFLLNLVVSDNAKSPAILVGASTTEDLHEATQAIASDPGISCSSLVRRQVTCALFEGLVTVSPMLEVAVNGTPTHIPIGSRLWFITPRSMTNQQRSTLIRTLRIERQFQGKLIRLQFARNLDGISQLPLVGGDRISWSNTAGIEK
jgi:hypothetical protein